MKILICDDQLEFVEEIIEKCNLFIREEKISANIVGTTDVKTIFEKKCDLLILDIEMPEMNGIEIKNKLAKEERPLIIFATSHPERMPEAFGRNVIGFMMKPIDELQLNALLKAAVDLLTADTYVEYEDGKKMCSKDILLIQVEKEYTQVVLGTGEKKSWMRKSLKIWEEELENFGFVRINEAFLLNCRYIKNFEGYKVVLLNGEKMKVSRRRKSGCEEKFIEYSRKISIHG